MVSRTGCRSLGERLMIASTLLIAVWYSSDCCSSCLLDLDFDGTKVRIHALPDHAALERGKKAPVTWKSSLPVGVVVSRPC